MRISDWSSDVCSSDLLGGALLDGVEHQIARQRDHRTIDRVGHVANGGPGPQPLYGLATWIDRIDRARKAALSDVEQGAPADSGRIVRGADDSDRARFEKQIERRPSIAVAGVRLCPERGARSEEHTSELQSLMRISYAVFCLKK